MRFRRAQRKKRRVRNTAARKLVITRRHTSLRFATAPLSPVRLVVTISHLFISYSSSLSPHPPLTHHHLSHPHPPTITSPTLTRPPSPLPPSLTHHHLSHPPSPLPPSLTHNHLSHPHPSILLPFHHHSPSPHPLSLYTFPIYGSPLSVCLSFTHSPATTILPTSLSLYISSQCKTCLRVRLSVFHPHSPFPPLPDLTSLHSLSIQNMAHLCHSSG